MTMALLAGCIFATAFIRAGAENRCGLSVEEAGAQCKLCAGGINSECGIGEKCFLSLPDCSNSRNAAVDNPGDTFSSLTSEQLSNARTIRKVADDYKIPKRGLVVALAAALENSRLRNLKSGSKGALGLFQQRPSEGWGSAAEVLDPVRATRAFLGVASHTRNSGLWNIKGWESMSVGQAASAVQVAIPAANFDRWASLAQNVASNLG